MFCNIYLNLFGPVSLVLHLNFVSKGIGLLTPSLSTPRLAHTLIEWELCKKATEPPEKAHKCAPGASQNKPPRNY